jgi:ABC-type Na+ transport system ATPase subunit NatA
MLLDLVGLADVDTEIGGYSRGIEQRLGVAQALINAPRLRVGAWERPSLGIQAVVGQDHRWMLELSGSLIEGKNVTCLVGE